MTPLLVLVLSAVLVGCTSAATPDPAQRPHRQHDLLTQEEIRDRHYTNVYDAVAGLRPNWLRTRGRTSVRNPEAGKVLVFMNGSLVGDVRSLRQFDVADVLTLQHLTPSQASARFGTQTNTGPVIVINTLPQR